MKSSMIYSSISMGINSAFVGFCYFVFLMFYLADMSHATGILTPGEALTDGSTLVSAGNKFEFGFFSRGYSNNRYLGIWYYGITPLTVVWVANGINPLNTTSGVLKIADDGNLILQDHTKRIVWSAGVQNRSSNGSFLQLLESGNLVLRNDTNGNEGNYIWQSFDHFSDTWLSGMKLGKDPSTGLVRYLTSWSSEDDPSPGQFTCRVRGPPLEFVIWKGDSLQYRSGPWNGVSFSGIMTQPNRVFDIKLLINAEETYSDYVPESKLVITRAVLSYSGEMLRYVWNGTSLKWLPTGRLPIDPCDNYGQCGANSICTISDPNICSCLPGYMPKSQQDWEIHAWSGGCVQKHLLNCSKGEGFKELRDVKVPDQWSYWINTSVSLKECEVECLKNCSCTAYANSNVSGQGSGCFIWNGDLIDIRRLVRPSPQNLYIRVTASDLGSKERKKIILVVISFSIALTVLCFVCSIILFKRAHKQAGRKKIQSPCRVIEDLELPTFEMVTIEKSTNNFSDSNKIGEGGFGPVYKGQISTGQEIAVKKNSGISSQGLTEFKNEVILISKLQHRNLVRLLGCCIQGEERMLIYEYMHNKSLDQYIYDAVTDTTRRSSLTWRRRFNIIIGIARGLLYLHRDSRLRIIHRDLKASNILLDTEMNPKISDFGIARALTGEQILVKTTRVIGTYGYMSPEYVIDGLYSMKSDVFSFGVLILEIVSGRKNRDFLHPDHNFNLLGHAWKLWGEGNASQLIDELMEESFPMLEVERCIQVGLLCVQKCPEDRPAMSTVLLMLDSESTMFPQPKKPGFYTERIADETEDSLDQELPTANNVTITLLGGR